MTLSAAQSGLIRFLAETPLFASMDEEQLAEIVRASRSRTLPKGSVLFFQDDPADGFYVVRSGSVAILLTSPDGSELILGDIRPGDFFGDLALVTGEPRSATASTMLKSELIIIPGRIFLALLDSRPEMTRLLLTLTFKRLYASTQRESALAFLDAPARLAQLLLQLEVYSTGPAGYITISQADLARRIGSTRQTVAKILGRWRRAGWLLTGRGRIVLLDYVALREAVQKGGG
jgi:CRP/FNR family cyclic AMP-dependent transcriptional regulator